MIPELGLLLTEQTLLTLVLAMVFSLTMMGYAFRLIDSTSPFGIFVGSFARMWFYVKAFDIYSSIKPTRATLFVAVSFIVTPIARIPLETLSLTGALFIIALMPLVFVAMLESCAKTINKEPPFNLRETGITSLPRNERIRLIPLAIELAVIGFVLGLFCLDASIWNLDQATNLVDLAIKIVFAAAVSGLLYWRKGQLDINLFMQLAIVFVIASMVLSVRFLAGGSGFVVAAIMSDLAKYSIVVFFLIALSSLASRLAIPSSIVMLLSWAPYSSAIGIGLMLTEYFGVSHVRSYSFLVDMILLVVFVTFLVLEIRNRAIKRRDRTEGACPEKPTVEQEILPEHCAVVFGSKNLTSREREVLEYLSKGRSTPYIAEHLVISKNTVQFHVKNIYAKLGVKSKQELLDLMEGQT